MPRIVSVVGYDDVDSAGMLTPGLTSMRQSNYELGRAEATLPIVEASDSGQFESSILSQSWWSEPVDHRRGSGGAGRFA